MIANARLVDVLNPIDTPIDTVTGVFAMQPLAHNHGAAGVGAEVAAMGGRGLAVGVAVGAPITVLLPAGSDEVSLQATLAFAAEGVQTMAVNALAQEELARAGATYVQVSGMYAMVDESAAESLA